MRTGIKFLEEVEMEISKGDRNSLRRMADDLEYIGSKAKKGKIWLSESVARDWAYLLRTIVKRVNGTGAQKKNGDFPPEHVEPDRPWPRR